MRRADLLTTASALLRAAPIRRAIGHLRDDDLSDDADWLARRWTQRPDDQAHHDQAHHDQAHDPLWLRAAAMAAAGLGQEALAQLEQADTYEALYTRGAIAHTLSRPQQALGDYDRAMRLRPEHGPTLALLAARAAREAQDYDQAHRRLEVAASIPEVDAREVLAERAALAISQGHQEAALVELRALAGRFGLAHAWGALEAPCFERAREPLRQALEQALKPQLGWLMERLSWLEPLTQAALPQGMRWLEADESNHETLLMRERFEGRGPLGTLLDPLILLASLEQAQRVTVVALGPGRATRGQGLPRALHWLADAEEPGRLWVALSAEHPAPLWLNIEADAASITRVIDAITGAPQDAQDAQAAQARFFLGYLGQLEVPDPLGDAPASATLESLTQALDISPYLDRLGWRASYDQDPWPDEILAQAGLTLALTRAKARAQAAPDAPERAWGMAWRGFWSRARLQIEVFAQHLCVAQVTYAPCGLGQQALSAVNATLGVRLPEDLPLDLAAQLLSWPLLDASQLHEQLQARLAQGRAEDEEAIIALMEALYVTRGPWTDQAQALLDGCAQSQLDGVRRGAALLSADLSGARAS